MDDSLYLKTMRYWQSWLIKSTLAIVVLAGLSGCGPSSNNVEKAMPMLEREAIQFERPSVADGQPVRLSDYTGQVVLVKFFATWCGSCSAMNPEIQAFYDQYQSKGVQIIAASIDKDPAVVKAYSEQHAIGYPIVMADTELLEQYGAVNAVPTVYILNRDHTVVSRFRGYRSRQALADLVDEHI